MAADHRRRVAGEQAALQQAFEVGRVQRPALMAQHVGRHPARRFQAAGGAFRRRLGEKQLLRLEKLPADGRQAGSLAAGASADRASAGSRIVSDAPRLGEATDEIVCLGIGVGRNLAGRPASGRSRR